MTTDFGVGLSMNGMEVRLRVPNPPYENMLEGLCGNNNGNRSGSFSSDILKMMATGPLQNQPLRKLSHFCIDHSANSSLRKRVTLKKCSYFEVTYF